MEGSNRLLCLWAVRHGLRCVCKKSLVAPFREGEKQTESLASLPQGALIGCRELFWVSLSAQHVGQGVS